VVSSWQRATRVTSDSPGSSLPNARVVACESLSIAQAMTSNSKAMSSAKYLAILVRWAVSFVRFLKRFEVHDTCCQDPLSSNSESEITSFGEPVGSTHWFVRTEFEKKFVDFFCATRVPCLATSMAESMEHECFSLEIRSSALLEDDA